MREPVPEADFVEFVWIWNHLHNQATPRVHRRVARWLAARVAARDRRLVLMAFRGCGKSTLVGLLCAWWLHRRPEARIVVLAAEQSLASRMVGHVRRVIERHPLCGHLHHGGEEAWAADRFTVRRAGAALRDPSMLAQGLLGNITGARADLVVCDDVEGANTCDTPGKRADLRARLAEAEFVLTPDGTLLFIGTPHTEDSLYRPGEPHLDGFARLEVPLLDDAGRSAWPERFDEAAVAGLRRRVGPLRFARQMLLQPVAAEAGRLDPALLIRYAAEPDFREANGRAELRLLGRRMISGGGYWDPAFGKAERGVGDGSVLAAGYADAEGNHFLHRVEWVTHSALGPDDAATQQCRRVAEVARDLSLPVVRVETNGIGRFLPGLLRRALAEAGAPCAVVEHANRRPKAERILAGLEPILAARRLHASEAVMRSAFPREMAEWRPEAKGMRDDALDAASGLILAEPVRLPLAAPPPRFVSWRGSGA